MHASTPHHPAEPFEDHDSGFDDDVLPVRPRAQYLTPLTALLMALILGGVGFYVGIRVEKSKTSSTGGSSAFARAFSAAGGTSTTAGASARRGTFGSGAAGSFAARFGGGLPGAAGGATIGSVSSVDGSTLYVQETGGNTVKVKLSSATTIKKSEPVSKKRVFPGDEVVIAGSKSANGTVQATSVTDSGAGASSSSGSSSTSGSSSGASSAISSLFGGG